MLSILNLSRSMNDDATPMHHYTHYAQSLFLRKTVTFCCNTKLMPHFLTTAAASFRRRE